MLLVARAGSSTAERNNNPTVYWHFRFFAENTRPRAAQYADEEVVKALNASRLHARASV